MIRSETNEHVIIRIAADLLYTDIIKIVGESVLVC